jgi:hypothetical protein
VETPEGGNRIREVGAASGVSEHVRPWFDSRTRTSLRRTDVRSEQFAERVEPCQSQRPSGARPTVWLRFDSRTRTVPDDRREEWKRRKAGIESERSAQRAE